MVDISQHEKIEQRLRKRPIPNDISYSEFVLFLARNGFVDYSSNCSSHQKFIFDKDNLFEIILFKKPHGNSDGIEEPYIKKALQAIDRIRSVKGIEYDQEGELH